MIISFIFRFHDVCIRFFRRHALFLCYFYLRHYLFFDIHFLRHFITFADYFHCLAFAFRFSSFHYFHFFLIAAAIAAFRLHELRAIFR